MCECQSMSTFTVDFCFTLLNHHLLIKSLEYLLSEIQEYLLIPTEIHMGSRKGWIFNRTQRPTAKTKA